LGIRFYPPLTPAEVIEILTALGFTKRGQTGSHAQYFRPAKGKRKTALVSVDVHYKEFDVKLMHSMVRQSQFSRQEFYGATKHTARKASVAFFTPEVA
jgi:predicted RNA binding protein YcfA (HicA-like mRNA interferase family)